MTVTENDIIRYCGGVASSDTSYSLFGVDVPKTAVSDVLTRATRLASLKFTSETLSAHPDEIDDYIVYRSASQVLKIALSLSARLNDENRKVRMETIAMHIAEYDRLANELEKILMKSIAIQVPLSRSSCLADVGLDFSGSKSDAPPMN